MYQQRSRHEYQEWKTEKLIKKDNLRTKKTCPYLKYFEKIVTKNSADTRTTLNYHMEMVWGCQKSRNA